MLHAADDDSRGDAEFLLFPRLLRRRRCRAGRHYGFLSLLRFDPIDEARRHWKARGWSDSAAGMAVVTAVMRVQQIFLARTDEVLKPLGLTFARYEVLMLLLFSKSGRLPLGKIGERLQVHAASVTNAIDRLEGDGLVARVPNPRDGRGTLARITPKGRRLAECATLQLNELVFAGVPHDERLVEALCQIRSGAGDF